MRNLPQIGQTFPCGTITKLLPQAGRNRAIRVEMVCPYCETTFSERFTIVRSGDRKSCGCKKREAYRVFCSNLVRRLLSGKEIRSIFEYAEVHGREEAAKHFEQSEWLVKSVWVMVRHEIKQSHSAARLSAIAAALNKDFRAGCRAWRLSRGRALAICRIARRNASDTATPVISEEPLTLPGHTLDDLLQDAISNAVAVATEVNRFMWRRMGELNTSELSRTKRSRYGWAYRAVLSMSAGERSKYTMAAEFLSICEYTFRERGKRRRTFITKWVMKKGW